ncbi:MAG: TIGR02594 family protein, partial [Patescibacteria group bacterium]
QSAILGTANNSRIVEYFSAVGHGWVKDDETAWCAAFLNWVLKESGLPHTGKLLARSFLTYGFPTDKPKLGDIVVLWRISKASPYGHCGLYVSENEVEIFILGGNEDGQVKIKAYPKYQLLAYRKIYE